MTAFTYPHIVKFFALMFALALAVAVALGYRAAPAIRIPAGNSAPASAGIAPSSPAGKPARLVIPAIQVDANVQHVGIGKSGNMAVPTNYKDAGWYRLGPRPGEAGSAVMAGHVDNALGLAGVFKNVSKLAPGDDVFVADDTGARIHFRVTRVKTYPYNEKNTDEVFARSGESRLNLITCTGKWIKSAKTYDSRVVVFTEKVE